MYSTHMYISYESRGNIAYSRRQRSNTTLKYCRYEFAGHRSLSGENNNRYTFERERTGINGFAKHLLGQNELPIHYIYIQGVVCGN